MKMGSRVTIKQCKGDKRKPLTGTIVGMTFNKVTYTVALDEDCCHRLGALHLTGTFHRDKVVENENS